MEIELEGYVETLDGVLRVDIIFDGEYYFAWEAGNLQDDLDYETIDAIVQQYDDKIYLSLEDYKNDDFVSISEYFKEIK